jgi:hypothetical protein
MVQQVEGTAFDTHVSGWQHLDELPQLILWQQLACWQTISKFCKAILLPAPALTAVAITWAPGTV